MSSSHAYGGAPETGDAARAAMVASAGPFRRCLGVVRVHRCHLLRVSARPTCASSCRSCLVGCDTASSRAAAFTSASEGAALNTRLLSGPQG